MAALNRAGAGSDLAHGLEKIGALFFAIIGIVVRAAPLGAFGAMAFTIGQYGLASLGKLAILVVGNTAAFGTPLSKLGPVQTIDITIPMPPGMQGGGQQGPPGGPQ